MSLTPPPTFQELPGDIYMYHLVPHEGWVDIIQRRNLNQAAYRRYQKLIPTFERNMEVLDYALDNNDLGLFRDWMRVNEPILARGLEIVPPKVVSAEPLTVLEAIAHWNPKFLAEAERYPGFVQGLEAIRERLMGSSGPRIGVGLAYPHYTARFVSALLEDDALADRILLPWLRSNVVSNAAEYLAEFIFNANPFVVPRLLDYIVRRGVPLNPNFILRIYDRTTRMFPGQERYVQLRPQLVEFLDRYQHLA